MSTTIIDNSLIEHSEILLVVPRTGTSVIATHPASVCDSCRDEPKDSQQQLALTSPKYFSAAAPVSEESNAPKMSRVAVFNNETPSPSYPLCTLPKDSENSISTIPSIITITSPAAEFSVEEKQMELNGDASTVRLLSIDETAGLSETSQICSSSSTESATGSNDSDDNIRISEATRGGGLPTGHDGVEKQDFIECDNNSNKVQTMPELRCMYWVAVRRGGVESSCAKVEKDDEYCFVGNGSEVKVLACIYDNGHTIRNEPFAMGLVGLNMHFHFTRLEAYQQQFYTDLLIATSDKISSSTAQPCSVSVSDWLIGFARSLVADKPCENQTQGTNYVTHQRASFSLKAGVTNLLTDAAAAVSTLPSEASGSETAMQQLSDLEQGEQIVPTEVSETNSAEIHPNNQGVTTEMADGTHALEQTLPISYVTEAIVKVAESENGSLESKIGVSKPENGSPESKIGESKPENGPPESGIGVSKPENGPPESGIGVTKSEVGVTMSEAGVTRSEVGVLESEYSALDLIIGQLCSLGKKTPPSDNRSPKSTKHLKVVLSSPTSSVSPTVKAALFEDAASNSVSLGGELAGPVDLHTEVTKEVARLPDSKNVENLLLPERKADTVITGEFGSSKMKLESSPEDVAPLRTLKRRSNICTSKAVAAAAVEPDKKGRSRASENFDGGTARTVDEIRKTSKRRYSMVGRVPMPKLERRSMREKDEAVTAEPFSSGEDDCNQKVREGESSDSENDEEDGAFEFYLWKLSGVPRQKKRSSRTFQSMFLASRDHALETQMKTDNKHDEWKNMSRDWRGWKFEEVSLDLDSVDEKSGLPSAVNGEYENILQLLMGEVPKSQLWSTEYQGTSRTQALDQLGWLVIGRCIDKEIPKISSEKEVDETIAPEDTQEAVGEYEVALPQQSRVNEYEELCPSMSNSRGGLSSEGTNGVEAQPDVSSPKPAQKKRRTSRLHEDGVTQETDVQPVSEQHSTIADVETGSLWAAAASSGRTRKSTSSVKDAFQELFDYPDVELESEAIDRAAGWRWNGEKSKSFRKSRRIMEVWFPRKEGLRYDKDRQCELGWICERVVILPITVIGQFFHRLFETLKDYSGEGLSVERVGQYAPNVFWTCVFIGKGDFERGKTIIIKAFLHRSQATPSTERMRASLDLRRSVTRPRRKYELCVAASQLLYKQQQSSPTTDGQSLYTFAEYSQKVAVEAIKRALCYFKKHRYLRELVLEAPVRGSGSAGGYTTTNAALESKEGGGLRKSVNARNSENHIQNSANSILCVDASMDTPRILRAHIPETVQAFLRLAEETFKLPIFEDGAKILSRKDFRKLRAQYLPSAPPPRVISDSLPASVTSLSTCTDYCVENMSSVQTTDFSDPIDDTNAAISYHDSGAGSSIDNRILKQGRERRLICATPDEVLQGYYDEDGFPRRAILKASQAQQRICILRCCGVTDEESDLPPWTAPVLIGTISNKGRAVFAAADIYKGDFVCEYRGRFLARYGEAKAQEEKYRMEGKGSFLFYFRNNATTCCVDGTEENESYGFARLINHSRKAPNLCAMVVPDVHSDSYGPKSEKRRPPHLVFLACKDIRAGQELLIDYGETNKDVIRENPWLAE